ncbi:DsbA family protein (plasmid) [Nitratireductor rhodophyticola]|jgi:protein-disulfide isomerase|uniref:DSBA oxidoreductase n=2 Tax=Nitratireductor TaxID=245876 RepID=K2MYA3_9HYPH|nr:MULTISPECIES: DsbA family protein [Nitratireductor]KAB2952785.1 MAG: DsbA family protein [Rhizobiaceae bacterium]MAW82644.1 disulfide bond formation protein DsbA [Parvularcula sp.]MBY8919007.1 DsbA family protein [Nitratireductor rhodophyticola]MEC9245325.1 DsbA family protein [Pseudomonadota bacterium]EKF40213.1 DSBA oxidoreductase [Nitratireductor indicus C115]
MKRRNLIFGMAATGMVATYPALLLAQPSTDALLAPGPLPEKSFGPEDAPVTIIEYASLTCPHCRTFHVNVWPELKKKYVDTGQVRFIMREFPFDPRSSAGFMLARCMGDDKWYPTIDLLYRTQDNWARVADGTEALKSVMGMTGMSTADFEKCLKDQELLDQVSAVAEAGKSFGVDSTPTFFINGQMQKGALSIERFSEIIDPLVTAAKQQGGSDE